MLVDPGCCCGGLPPRNNTEVHETLQRRKTRNRCMKLRPLCWEGSRQVRVPLTDETQARIEETVNDGKMRALEVAILVLACLENPSGCIMLERVSSFSPVKVTTSGGFRKRRVVTLDCRTLVRAPTPTVACRRNAAVKAHSGQMGVGGTRYDGGDYGDPGIITAQGASPFAPRTC